MRPQVGRLYLSLSFQRRLVLWERSSHRRLEGLDDPTTNPTYLQSSYTHRLHLGSLVRGLPITVKESWRVEPHRWAQHQRTITSFLTLESNPPNQPRPRRCAMPTETLYQPRYDYLVEGHHERLVRLASVDQDQHLLLNMMEFVFFCSLAGSRTSAGSYLILSLRDNHRSTQASTIQSQGSTREDQQPRHDQCGQNGR